MIELTLGKILQSVSSEAFNLNDKKHLGEKIHGKITYQIVEALFLSKKTNLIVYDKNKKLTKEQFEKWCKKQDNLIESKLAVFSWLKSQGYTPKSAVKYGADFRVYGKGIKPGQDHAFWLVKIIASNKISVNEITGAVRITHSTKKKLLLAIVDEELSPSFYQIDWIKP